MSEIYAAVAQASLDCTISSNAPSPPTIEPETRGQKLIDRNLHEVLNVVWTSDVTTKSDFARAWADYIAMAASMDLITTRVADTVYSRHWQITAKGLHLLEKEISPLSVYDD